MRWTPKTCEAEWFAMSPPAFSVNQPMPLQNPPLNHLPYGPWNRIGIHSHWLYRHKRAQHQVMLIRAGASEPGSPGDAPPNDGLGVSTDWLRMSTPDQCAHLSSMRRSAKSRSPKTIHYHHIMTNPMRQPLRLFTARYSCFVHTNWLFLQEFKLSRNYFFWGMNFTFLN